MQEEYRVESDRYGYIHRFVKKDGNKYAFAPQEKWMPLYVTYDSDGETIILVDTDGGPLLFRGWKNSEIEIDKIISNKDKEITFVLKEIENDRGKTI